MKEFEVTVLTHLNDVVKVMADDLDDALKKAKQWADDEYPTAVLVEAINGTFMDPVLEEEIAKFRHPSRGGAFPTPLAEEE